MTGQWTRNVLLALAVGLLGACGGGGAGAGNGDGLATAADAVRASALSVRLDEDGVFAGTLSATAPAGPVTFGITASPGQGTVKLAAATGTFSYTPAANYFGNDSFAFSATDATGAVATATVAIWVDGVDDPPRISALPDVSNSPHAYEVVLPLAIEEVDDEPLTVTATAQDSSVVEVLVDPTGQNLILRPQDAGTSRVQVRVADGGSAVSTDLMFTVQDVARPVTVRTTTPSTRAIVLTNTNTSAVDFELTHNGHHAFANMEQILDAIRAQPDEVVNEPLERKIWRFIRDNTYHASPVNEETWMNATWPLLNSFGWGFCSHIAAVFLTLGEVAGYETRMWYLNGHVVPEIRVHGRWGLYDPDLAVYYHRRDGGLAGVEELAADPTLVSSPFNPIFDPGTDFVAYGQAVASIYGSSLDNRTVDFVVSSEAFRGSTITLPAGAGLIYPGRWTENPIGYDGPTPYTIEQFRQARLALPANFSGQISIPWVLWDVQGTGVVRINGRDFDAGSQELQEFLVRPGASVTQIESIGNHSNLALIMLINPLWYDMLEVNDLVLSGRDVWAIEASTVLLPAANQPPPPVPASLRRPRA